MKNWGAYVAVLFALALSVLFNVGAHLVTYTVLAMNISWIFESNPYALTVPLWLAEAAMVPQFIPLFAGIALINSRFLKPRIHTKQLEMVLVAVAFILTVVYFLNFATDLSVLVLAFNSMG